MRMWRLRKHWDTELLNSCLHPLSKSYSKESHSFWYSVQNRPFKCPMAYLRRCTINGHTPVACEGLEYYFDHPMYVLGDRRLHHSMRLGAGHICRFLALFKNVYAIWSATHRSSWSLVYVCFLILRSKAPPKLGNVLLIFCSSLLLFLLFLLWLLLSITNTYPHALWSPRHFFSFNNHLKDCRAAFQKNIVLPNVRGSFFEIDYFLGCEMHRKYFFCVREYVNDMTVSKYPSKSSHMWGTILWVKWEASYTLEIQNFDLRHHMSLICFCPIRHQYDPMACSR